MLLDQKWENAAGKGIEDAVILVMDQDSEFTLALCGSLRGEIRLLRDNPVTASGWCNRPAVERALRRLLPNAGIELPPMTDHRYYHCRVMRGCLRLCIVRAREGDQNGEGFEAETAPAIFRFHERG